MRKLSPHSSRSTAGFTLFQVSILLTVAALVLVTLLPSSQSGVTLASQSSDRMTAIFKALRQYQTANGVLPCPADPTMGMGYDNAAGYGVASSNTGTTSNCIGGSAPNAAYADTTNHIAIGMVPVKTLGLPLSAALDAFGRDITYAVDTSATSCWPTTTLPGAIQVYDNGQTSNTVAALISYGKSGHGAWLPYAGTGGTGTASRFNTGSTDVVQLANAQVTSGITNRSAYINNSYTVNINGTNTTVTAGFIKGSLSNDFDSGNNDNVVMYKYPQFNINQLPAAASNILTVAVTATTPASGGTTTAIASGGSYTATSGTSTTGTLLTFKVAFPMAVTVTGTPYLSLTVGNTVRKAFYSSGSGTNTLNFTYTLGSTASPAQTPNDSDDQSPLGMSLASPIQLNGGTIVPTADTSTTFPACLLAFTPPALTGVVVPCANCLYATNANNAIDIYSSNSTSNYKYIGGFTSPLGLSSPQYLAVHQTSGVVDQIWVADYGNSRVQKFNGSGTYSLELTGLVAVTGVALDSSANVWVDGVNSGTSYAEEFAVPGTSTAIPTYSFSVGTCSALSTPKGIAGDASGNVWIVNYGGSYYKDKVNSTGTCQHQDANGTLKTPTGVVLDVSGNVWVVDTTARAVKEYSPSTYAQTATSTTLKITTAGAGQVTVDTGGNLWVADTTNGLVEFNSSGTWQQTITPKNTLAGGIAAGR